MEKSAGAVDHDGKYVLAADTAVVVDGQFSASRPTTRKRGGCSRRCRAARSRPDRRQPATRPVRVRRRGIHRGVVPIPSRADIDSYVASGEGRDKAGGYAIQGLASRFIPRIDGSYSNVVGLPVHRVGRLITEMGYAEADREI